MPIAQLTDLPRDDPKALILIIQQSIQDSLNLSKDRVWVFRNEIDPSNASCDIWDENPGHAPIVLIYCKSKYSSAMIKELIYGLKEEITKYCKCDKSAVFIGIQKFESNQLFVNEKLYEHD